MAFTRRRDATHLRDLPGLRKVMPHLMPTRIEGTVYFPQRIEVDGLLDWLDEVNEGRPAGQRITLFHVLLTGIGRTIRLRPEMNRFVSGRRTYAHKEISVSFIVKAAMDDESPESEVRLVLTGQESVQQVRDLADAAVGRERRQEQGQDDRLIDLLSSWPRPVLALIARLVRSLDYHNLLPRFLREAIPLYTSVYVVNTGSIGIAAPYHHLYEHGSASIFVAIGKVAKEAVVDEHDQVVARRVLDIVYTLDERASDGFYFARTAEVFRRLVSRPELMAKTELTVEEILAGWPSKA